MRAIAKEKYQGKFSTDRLIFLKEEDQEFETWSDSYPIPDQVNAVVANFGVINYIQDLEKLFKVFHSLTASDAQLFINLLNVPPKVLYTKLLRNVVKSLVKGSTVKAASSYKDVTHETSLYKPKDIEKAAGEYFDLVSTKSLGKNSDFTLLHFRKI